MELDNLTNEELLEVYKMIEEHLKYLKDSIIKLESVSEK